MLVFSFPHCMNNNPPNPPPADPLAAVSPEDKILLENCQNKLMSIVTESCNLCHEEWFDLDVKNGVCGNYRKSSKFQPSNNMYPKPLICQNSLRWRKYLFHQFMHFFRL